ncbi:type I pullulanase [Paenibacillus sp. FSL W8-0426]|uniref:type I pullulanase n=1 Tax=Paenibacillus sp. FSL W8-0426 TaxID=2921714 RepID=UPI0030DDD792
MDTKAVGTMLEWTEFRYEGNDLGLTYTRAASTFKLWAPTARQVTLLIFDEQGTYGEDGRVTEHEGGISHTMTRSAEGIWSLRLEGDWNSHYYMYRLVHEDGRVAIAPDPYAHAVTANGQRTAIIDMDATNPADWENDARPAFLHPIDAVVYELHVRDFSSDPQADIPFKGKYLAFAASGLTDRDGNAIGVDHLAELGITHVHLMPVADYQTVDELLLADAGPHERLPYNWGYDPQHYNVPEGSYSTDPRDPSTRIREFKTMVQSLHRQGIRVVLDVVYNHTFSVNEGPFDRIVPGYYYRYWENGTLSNGSGVGNELATERPMVRKYILDSLLHWAEEYHVDGFRFDLMGLIDTDTMNELTRELKERIDPAILIYGEPWTGGDSPLNRKTLKGAQRGQGFAVFNDHFRGAIKGDSDGAGKGFATGAGGKEKDIVAGVAGAIDDFTITPAETINYVTAHDNLNLWDKIATTMNLRPQLGFPEWQGGQPVGGGSAESAVRAADPYRLVDEEDVLECDMVRRSLLSSGIVLTSQGIPFLHAGDEMLRSKFGDQNSYRSDDVVNSIVWKNKSRFRAVFDYYRGLIQLRRTHPAFRMIHADQIRKHLQFLRAEGQMVVFMLKDGANKDSWNRIVVIYNASAQPQPLTLPEGTWHVVVNDRRAGTEAIDSVQGTVLVERLSLMVLYDMEQAGITEPAVIEVNAPRQAYSPGEKARIRAVVLDSLGNVVPNAKTTWTSSAPEVLRIEEDGTIEAIQAGDAVITARYGDIAAYSLLLVEERYAERLEIVGENVLYTTRISRLRALVLDQFGQPLSGMRVRWHSSHPETAAVSSAGIVRGLAPGHVRITAETEGVRGSIDIAVHRQTSRLVTLRYERQDRQYDGWDVWVWGTGMQDGAVRLERNGDAAEARFRVASGLQHLGLIIRLNEWEAKDTCGDRYVDITPEDENVLIVVQSGSDHMQVIRDAGRMNDLSSA